MIMEAVRSIISQGNSSLSVVLPKYWVKMHNLKKGNELLLMGNDVLLVVPNTIKEERKEELKRLVNSANAVYNK